MYLYYVQLWLNYCVILSPAAFLSLYYPVSNYYFNYHLITIKLINCFSPNHYCYLANWNRFSKSFTLLKIFPIKYDHKIFFKCSFTLGTIGTPLVYISTSLFFSFTAKTEKSHWRSNFVLLNYIFCTIFSNSDVSRVRKVNMYPCSPFYQTEELNSGQPKEFEALCLKLFKMCLVSHQQQYDR